MKTMKTLMIAAAMLISVSSAQAEPKLYVGADLQRVQLKDTNIGENGLNAGGVHVGVRVNENMSLELGTSKTLEGKASGTKTNNQNYTFDVIGHLPVTESKNFELLGSLGLVHSLSEVEVAGVSVKQDDLSWAVGAGAQYHLNENLAVRTLVRYEDVELKNTGSDSTLKYTVGLNYTF